jgi:hypothetical protein
VNKYLDGIEKDFTFCEVFFAFRMGHGDGAFVPKYKSYTGLLPYTMYLSKYLQFFETI